MKTLVILAAIIALCSASAIPLVPGDNSHYVEGESRYIWITDGDDGPRLADLHEPVQPLSDARNGANNQYHLFSRSNPNVAQILVDGNINSVRNSIYDPNKPLVVLVHGWTNSAAYQMNVEVRQAFFAVQDCNVIVVDWSEAAGGSYLRAVGLVPSVGQFLGNFITWLINNAGGNWNNVHFIGYSLGAHVVGVAGRQTGGRPARVTGLDPAGPLWRTNNNRLSSDAGQYVEAIHTDGWLQGIMNPVGDADFYPNGGRNQPGCNNDSGCNHVRSYKFFTSTVLTNHFIGRRCTDVTEAFSIQCSGSMLNMGNGIITKRGNGLYGLTTGSEWPF